MAFIKPYDKKCKVTQGGIRKLYLFGYQKYKRYQITINGMELLSFPSTYIYKFDCNGSYNQNSSDEGGAVYFDHSASVDLSDVYNELDIQTLLHQDLRCIVETNNGDYLILGTFNGLRGTTTNTSGTDKAEFNGFKVDLTGKEAKPILYIDNLEDAGFIIVDDVIGLNYDLNFNIN